MKRKEEIELAWLNKAVQSNHRYDEKSFKEAVEWADKTMIEKACEWLKENAWSFAHSFDGEPYYDTEMMINAFEVAMGE